MLHSLYVVGRIDNLKLAITQERIILEPLLDVGAITLDPANLGADSVEALFDGAVKALRFIG